MTDDLDDTSFRLVACNEAGIPADPSLLLTESLHENCAATAELYRMLGYRPPWIGYLTAVGTRAVGGGAFIGAPRDKRVEIAYFTLSEWQGRGIASRTAAALVQLARQAAPEVTIFAKTMPEAGPSTSILTRLGFIYSGVVDDHEIGSAWAWELPPALSFPD